MGLSRRQRVGIPAGEFWSLRALVITALEAASEAKRTLERLALVRDRAKPFRQVRRELQRIGLADSIGQNTVGANRKPVVSTRYDRAK